MRTETTSEVWPNFFIVGAERAGTTSLYEYLRRSPSVYMSNIKEPNFFVTNIPENTPFHHNLVRDRRSYLDLFRKAKGKTAIGEASPTYLIQKESPELIHKSVPDAKIIMILRDPIERAFSHYLMNVRNGWEKLDFLEAIKKDQSRSPKGIFVTHMYVEAGFYSEQLLRFIELFGEKNVKVLFFEEFVRDTPKGVSEVFTFLGVNDPLPENIHAAYNSSSTPITGFQIRRRAAKFFVYSKPSILAVKALSDLLPRPAWTYLKRSLLPVKDSLSERVVYRNIVRPEINPEAVDLLKGIYNEDVSRLEKILHRHPPWVYF